MALTERQRLEIDEVAEQTEAAVLGAPMLDSTILRRPALEAQNRAYKQLASKESRKPRRSTIVYQIA